LVAAAIVATTIQVVGRARRGGIYRRSERRRRKRDRNFQNSRASSYHTQDEREQRRKGGAPHIRARRKPSRGELILRICVPIAVQNLQRNEGGSRGGGFYLLSLDRDMGEKVEIHPETALSLPNSRTRKGIHRLSEKVRAQQLGRRKIMAKQAQKGKKSAK